MASLADLPSEILDEIAAHNELTYRAMLAVPRFARSLTPGKIVDFMIGFGHWITITNGKINWYRHKLLHRLGGPAVEWVDGDREWLVCGRYHNTNGPALEHVYSGTLGWFENGTAIYGRYVWDRLLPEYHDGLLLGYHLSRPDHSWAIEIVPGQIIPYTVEFIDRKFGWYTTDYVSAHRDVRGAFTVNPTNNPQ